MWHLRSRMPRPRRLGEMTDEETTVSDQSITIEVYDVPSRNDCLSGG